MLSLLKSLVSFPWSLPVTAVPRLSSSSHPPSRILAACHSIKRRLVLHQHLAPIYCHNNRHHPSVPSVQPQSRRPPDPDLTTPTFLCPTSISRALSGDTLTTQTTCPQVSWFPFCSVPASHHIPITSPRFLHVPSRLFDGGLFCKWQSLIVTFRRTLLPSRSVALSAL